MNLIEQLGDYEKVKSIIISNEDGYNFYSNYYEYYSDNSTYEDSINIMDIEKSILEYRRENNIFEVGDKVVFVSEKMDFLDDDQIHSISVITENNLPKVCGLYVSFEAIKHATDDEIKVGHRI